MFTLNPVLALSEWVLGDRAEDGGLRALWPDWKLLAEGGRREPDPQRPQEQEEPADVALQAAATLRQRQGKDCNEVYFNSTFNLHSQG